MSARRPLRLAAAAALASGLGISTLVLAAPARAVPPGCSFSEGHSESTTAVSAWNYMICPTYVVDLRATIAKDGVLVAQGTGSTSYTCVGSSVNNFLADGWESFTAHCG